MPKVILVTGGIKGLGYAITKSLCCDNIVIANYVKESNLANKVSNELKVDTYKCDIANELEVKEMLNYIINKYGKLDVLINNAGISKDSLLLEKKVEDFKEVINTNLIGTFIMSKEASLRMDKGLIINIASNNAIDSYYPESADYDASKAGVISLTHNFAEYLAPNIRVNAIAPGWIDTEMNKDMDESYRKKEEEKILLGRFAKPEEIASLVKFLVSDEASYLNDSVIKIDGGIR